jgi:succinate dehydrogenase / fumarate reductase cytochrome b subunit
MATTDKKSGAAARPLSPHLMIYRPSWTMVMSITHRITGTALYLGTLLLVVWLVAAASGKASYDSVQWIFGSLLGQLILFGFTWALFHHMLGGIRHFIWDAGHGFEAETRFLLAKANLVLSIALTVLVWIVAYAVR